MSDDILERCIKSIKRSTYGMLRKENKFMTNKEALQALLDGKKIRKTTWNKNYYIVYNVKTDIINDMDGNRCEFCCAHPNWELYEEPNTILDDEEKAYLSAVIKPFKNRIISITKKEVGCTNEYLLIIMPVICHPNVLEFFALPSFSKSSLMYKGMVENKEYTLKELGL